MKNASLSSTHVHALHNTAWCSEIGSLTSVDACNSGASDDAREPISLHQAVLSCLSMVRAQDSERFKIVIDWKKEKEERRKRIADIIEWVIGDLQGIGIMKQLYMSDIRFARLGNYRSEIVYG